VWELIETYKSMDEDWERFKAYYEWLNKFQLRMALEYYEAYPKEIDARIAENLSWTREKLYTTYPFMRPPWVPDPRETTIVPETVTPDR